jgi:hypothetical protein
MTKVTQKEIILKLLESQPDTWFRSYEIRGKYTPFGFAGHQADRRARELAEIGAIDVRHKDKYAEYRMKQKELPKPQSIRPPVVPSQFAREYVGKQEALFKWS